MTICIKANNESITLHIYGPDSCNESDKITHRLKLAHIPFIKRNSTEISIDIRQVIAANIVDLDVFEANIFTGFNKISSPKPKHFQSSAGYYYGYSLGGKRNIANHQQKHDELDKQLDNDKCDLIEWFLDEQTLFNVHSVKSDEYLRTLFADYKRHVQSTNQFIPLSQGELKSQCNDSPLALFPLEVMLHITGYVDNHYKNKGEQVFGAVAMKYEKKENDLPFSL